MRRVSNLAFNQEFPGRSGLKAIPSKHVAKIARDPQNRFDDQAVGIWLEDQGCVVGWLYRKDKNREAVLQKLTSVDSITCQIAVEKGKKVVVFWL